MNDTKKIIESMIVGKHGRLKEDTREVYEYTIKLKVTVDYEEDDDEDEVTDSEIEDYIDEIPRNITSELSDDANLVTAKIISVTLK